MSAGRNSALEMTGTMDATKRNDSYEAMGLWTRERLGYLVYVSALRWPEREMIYFERRRYTYADVARWTSRVACELSARGLNSGDRIFIQAENSIELLVLIFASWRIGLVTVPIIPGYRHHEVSQIVADTRPAAIVVTMLTRQRNYCVELDEVCATEQLSSTVKFVLGSEPPSRDWSAFPTEPTADFPIDQPHLPEPAEAEKCLLILFTSGTTARPKGAMIASRAIISNTRTWVTTLGITETDVWFTASPLAHIAALSTAVFTPMLVGGRTVIAKSWDGEKAAELIAQERATVMGGAAIFLHDLIQCYSKRPDITHRIGYFLSGGAVTPPTLVEAADELGICAVRSYGMTELAGTAALTRRDDPLVRRAYFDGKLNIGVEIGIVDEDRRPLPIGETGEIRIRGPQNMLGYTDPVATAASMDDDGWLYSGDVGRMDEEGWIQVTGRLKDIINRGGEKFSAEDIESVIMGHGDVLRAAVLGAPDKRFGEVVAAFIKLRDGIAWEGPEALLAYLIGRGLAKAKLPVQWHVLPDFPLTATGKVQKQQLRDMLKAAAEAG